MVAVITPPGEGGIAALRIAGKYSLNILSKHFRSVSDRGTTETSVQPFLMRYGHFVDVDGGVIDEIMAVYMPAGRSYTGRDQVEIFCHGGHQVVRLIQDSIVKSGARVAEPGEFTRLAFLAGRIDLTKAEAVAEIIAANTDSSFKAAREHLLGAYQEQIGMLRNGLVDVIAEVEASIDYPEDGIEAASTAKLTAKIKEIIHEVKSLADSYRGGRIINEGFTIVIGGRPNAGKSSLFNLLLKQERALVTPTAGTTRDYLSEWIELEGYKVNLIDTAGLRQGGGAVEKEGQKSTRRIMEKADLVVWMIDISLRDWRAKLTEDLGTLGCDRKLLIGNKIDVVKKSSKPSRELSEKDILEISCTSKLGIEALRTELVRHINEKMPDLSGGVIVTSARHSQKLKAALKNLKTASDKLQVSETPELTAFDLRLAINAIDEITGKIYNEDILGRIFAKFCIGK